MERLIKGLIDFKRTEAAGLRPHFRTLAVAQAPEVLMFACSDSRVVPHLLTSARPGELFLVRSVGNIVAPADASGRSLGDVSEAAAVEYALEVLGIRDVAVCGHSNCGAMKALLKGRHQLDALAPNLVEWLAHAEAARGRMATADCIDRALPEDDQLSQANVLLQLDHVATYPAVAKRLAAGRLRLHALWFDIANTMVSLYEKERGRFVALDEREIVRLLEAKKRASRKKRGARRR